MGPIQPRRQNHLPASYRIVLALSLALFLHSVLGAALALHLPSRSAPEMTRVELTLVAAGTAAEVDTRPSQPTQASRPSVVTEANRPEPAQPRAIASNPEAAVTSAEPEVQARRSPAKPSPAKSSSIASDNRQQGQSSPIPGADSAITSQIPSETGDEPPSYEQELAQQISAEMGQQKVALPNASRRQQLEPLELEVRLMKNGTLVGARVTRTSGVDEFDQSALQAALRASPYPEPPASQQSGTLRYRITFYLESAPPG